MNDAIVYVLLKLVILDAYNRSMGQIVILGVCNRSMEQILLCC